MFIRIDPVTGTEIGGSPLSIVEVHIDREFAIAAEKRRDCRRDVQHAARRLPSHPRRSRNNVLVEESGAMVVGADNLSFEAFPAELDTDYVPVHTYLLAEQGAPILELVYLEELSRDKVYEFAFIGGSLKLRGSDVALPVARCCNELAERFTPYDDSVEGFRINRIRH